MDIPTRNLSKYVQDKGINLSKMHRDTGLSYMALYDSLMNPDRDRDLRAGELFLVCRFLGVDHMDFADKPDEQEEMKCSF